MGAAHQASTAGAAAWSRSAPPGRAEAAGASAPAADRHRGDAPARSGEAVSGTRGRWPILADAATIARPSDATNTKITTGPMADPKPVDVGDAAATALGMAYTRRTPERPALE